MNDILTKEKYKKKLDALTTDAIVYYSTFGGNNFAILRKYITNIVDVTTIMPCPFLKDWVVGLVSYQQSVLALIDPDLYVNDVFKDDPKQHDIELHPADTFSYGNQKAAIICKYNNVEFAILCDVFNLSNIEAMEEHINTSTNQRYTIFTYQGNNKVFGPDLSDFVNQMKWLDNIKQHHEDSSVQNHADNNNDQVEEDINANNDDIADQKTSLDGSLLHIGNYDSEIIVDGKFIDRMESFKHDQIVEKSPCMPEWLDYFIEYDNIILPVIQMTVFEQFKNKKFPRHDNEEEEITIMILIRGDYLLGVEIERYGFTFPDEIIEDGDLRKASVDGKLYDLADINIIFNKLHDGTKLPQKETIKKDESLSSFILFQVYDKLCAVSLRDCYRISRYQNLSILEDSPIDSAESTNFEFVGMVTGVGNSPIPTFDITKQLHGNDEQDDAAVKAIIIVGSQLHNSFGILAHKLVGFSYFSENNYTPVDINTKLFKGFLRVDGEQVFVISENALRS